MKKTFVAPKMDVKKVEANCYLRTTSIPAVPGETTDATAPVETRVRIW